MRDPENLTQVDNLLLEWILALTLHALHLDEDIQLDAVHIIVPVRDSLPLCQGPPNAVTTGTTIPFDTAKHIYSMELRSISSRILSQIALLVLQAVLPISTCMVPLLMLTGP